MLERREPAPEGRAGGEAGSDVRDYLAEERTFLAWIRTMLGLMGFGFLLARVDRMLTWLGTTIIAVGVVLLLLSIERHRRSVEELNRPQIARRHPSREGVFLALILAAGGVAMALYLILA